MELLGKAMKPEFWQEVRTKDCFKKYRDELDALWKKHCENVPIYALKYSDFIKFKTTGNRSVYEGTYFTRRLAMDCSCLLSLIYPEEEKYLNRLMDEIYAICDEYTWCLPAHQGQFEKNDNLRVDLFASETGFALAEVYTLMGDRLEPLIRDRIRVEFDRRVVAPYTKNDNYGWWENGTSNWTAVCTCSVAGAIMLLRPDLEPQLESRFIASMDKYLTGFMDDGMCLEGCGYWHYGFGFFTVFADMIRNFTEGRVDYFKNKKVKTVATLIQKMFLTGKASVSFADGGKGVTYHLGLVHYLKKEYPDDVVVYDPSLSYNYDGCGRFCLQLRSAIWLDEDLYNNPANDKVSQVTYAEDSQWFIKRTANYGFAAKGGNNAELHNHNDVGSFIYAKEGHQVLMDLGAGSYTRQYFGPERYTILQASSRGHSVPVIGSVNQGAGKNFASVNTKYEDGIFSTDIAGAYPLSELKSLKRSFSFNEDSVTMKDEFVYEGKEEVIDRVVTTYKPEVNGNVIKVDNTVVTFDETIANVAINSEPINDTTTCYFIDFKLNDLTKPFVLEIK